MRGPYACCLRLAAMSSWKGSTSQGRQRSGIAILFSSSDTRTQSGCRLPNWSIVVRAVGRSTSHVLAIGVSSYMFHSGLAALLRKEVITARTWLPVWADVYASLNFGQTQATCVKDSGTASEPCGQIGDWAIPISFKYVWTG